MIRYEFEAEKFRVAAYDGDKCVGECTFVNKENVWHIEHTNVDKEYGGQGIAAKLVECVVDNARKQKIKIQPVCTYAVKAFEKNPEYSDVKA